MIPRYNLHILRQFPPDNSTGMTTPDHRVDRESSQNYIMCAISVPIALFRQFVKVLGELDILDFTCDIPPIDMRTLDASMQNYDQENVPTCVHNRNTGDGEHGTSQTSSSVKYVPPLPEPSSTEYQNVSICVDYIETSPLRRQYARVIGELDYENKIAACDYYNIHKRMTATRSRLTLNVLRGVAICTMHEKAEKRSLCVYFEFEILTYMEGDVFIRSVKVLELTEADAPPLYSKESDIEVQPNEVIEVRKSESRQSKRAKRRMAALKSSQSCDHRSE